jgi:hypothetical protein
MKIYMFLNMYINMQIDMDMEDMDMYIVSSNQNRKVFIKNKRYKIEGVYLLGFLNIAAANTHALLAMLYPSCGDIVNSSLVVSKRSRPYSFLNSSGVMVAPTSSFFSFRMSKSPLGPGQGSRRGGQSSGLLVLPGTPPSAWHRVGRSIVQVLEPLPRLKKNLGLFFFTCL